MGLPELPGIQTTEYSALTKSKWFQFSEILMNTLMIMMKLLFYISSLNNQSIKISIKIITFSLFLTFHQFPREKNTRII